MKIDNNISFGMALKMPSKAAIAQKIFPNSARDLELCRTDLKAIAKDVNIKLDIIEHPIEELNKVRITVTPSFKTPIKKIINLLHPEKYRFIEDEYVNCGEDVLGRIIGTASLGRHNILHINK